MGFLLLLFAQLPPATGATISLKPIADTTLLQAYPSNNFGGNEYFNSGTTQNYDTNRALLKFDVASALPRGAKILSASLTVAVVKIPDDGSTPSNFALHRMLVSWGEGTGSGHPPQQTGLGRLALTNEATWFERLAFTTNHWSAGGGVAGVDFLQTPSGDTYIYGTDFSPYTFESSPSLVADVQLWLDNPGTNFGWLMLSQDETSHFSARRFASREDTNRAPVLTLEFLAAMINRITLTNAIVYLQFTGEVGYAYAVQHSDSLSSSNWQTFTNLPSLGAATEITVTNAATVASRCYRLRIN